MRIFLNLVILIALFGCASTGIVPIDNGTYMVSKRSAQVGSGPPVGAKADVYREANDFCAQMGKKVETIDFQGTDSGFARPASASLQFKCVE